MSTLEANANHARTGYSGLGLFQSQKSAASKQNVIPQLLNFVNKPLLENKPEEHLHHCLQQIQQQALSGDKQAQALYNKAYIQFNGTAMLNIMPSMNNANTLYERPIQQFRINQYLNMNPMAMQQPKPSPNKENKPDLEEMLNNKTISSPQPW